MSKIILTGGGTAGHVTPNIALISKLKKEGFDIYYIGTAEGIEKRLINEINIPFYGISSGKLRRYFDIHNITDMQKVIKGCAESRKIIDKIKPNVVFSKGGFVAVPVVIGAWLNKVPVVVHESDLTCGLANKIAIPFASCVCTAFEETSKHIKNKNVVHTGTPIREELYNGNKEKGLELCGFKNNKPVILIMGGSLGSVKINNIIHDTLDELLKEFNIIHICGKNNIDYNSEKINGYKQFEYVTHELSNLYAATDLIVSRAGANSISEYLILKKPSLLIPLSAKASRGDQILNAKFFEKQGYALMLAEEQLSKELFLKKLHDLALKKKDFINNMKRQSIDDSCIKITNILKKYL